MTPEFAVGMGGNRGDRKSRLLGAARFLSTAPGISGLRLSALYETEPWGDVRGGPFLNAVAAGRFRGEPHDLLVLCRETELRAGSATSKRGDARFLDLDILCMEGVVSSDPVLRLPHPRLAQRRFVLVPLGEVWPGEVPGIGRTPSQLLPACPDTGWIRLVAPQPPPGEFWETPA